ncbi:hypothetical protein JB92DRAFT_3138619 [Gautieria morchelliformis]|nr:hypothetical protein JB92DRAFT_3138619 [Gautieria morchelliformis]
MSYCPHSLIFQLFPTLNILLTHIALDSHQGFELNLFLQVPSDTVALHSDTAYRHAIPSFHLRTSPMVAPTDGTQPSSSRTRDKQPAHTPLDTTPNSGTTPIPPFPMPSSTDQRIALLEAQISSLLAMIQQTQQAVLQVTQQQPQPPQQPPPPQPLLPQPPPPQQQPLQPSSQQVLPPAAPQPNAFVPPISFNPASGMSLDRSFPHVDPVLRLAITKHEFRPGNLYKLDAIIKEKPTVKSFEISDNGAFTQ